MHARQIRFSLALVLVTGACTGGGLGTRSSGPATSGTTSIPQPSLEKLNERTRRRLAPDNQRIDLAVPSFSNPTQITNPLFPISALYSAVLVGQLNGRPWRAETTLLPETGTVDWNGQRVKTRESQFVAYLGGRIFEVAVDHYAQADDGSVWYFGEDAFTYEHGRLADTEGTWLAGVTGPPAMIMPAHPQVGDVYRTENIPGLVFEQVTVKKIAQTVSGPTGLVLGAMVGRELHMDERRLEDKTFAPGYGEFLSGKGRTFEATALAVPVDALPGPSPAGLRTLSSGAIRVFQEARSRHWHSTSASVATLRTAWDALRSADVPRRLAGQMSEALHVLEATVHARDARRAALAALDVAQASLDIRLRYEPPVRIDTARFGLWARELQADSAAGDRAAVTGDVTTLEWIRDRVPPGSAAANLMDERLRSIRRGVRALPGPARSPGR